MAHVADVHDLEYVLDRTWGHQELCAFIHEKFLLYVVFHYMEVWPSIFELFDVRTCGKLLPLDVVPVLSVFDCLLVALVIVSCIEESRVEWVVYLHLNVVVLVLVAALLDVVDHVVETLVLIVDRVGAHVFCRINW